ncbi:MAG: 1,4-alpha-glucan branching protein domain-containing protein [Bacillota bacterium]|nr:1,4-alpha-glucan branching protein domain-containing protein [Bacillota bacterium]MDW7683604.1 1,4-alpha-glucan branching protein domain-containing protein [Bacillota bacterium]
MPEGYVNIVLHAHLPFVYTAQNQHHLEEKWFFEAMTESYLPLLLILEELKEDKIDYALTLSLSPTLLAMLDHPILSRRYEDYLNRLILLAESEIVRTRGSEFHRLAHFYRERLHRLKDAYTRRFNRNLTGAFASLAESGHLELITTCATHGYLPLIRNREAVKAQIAVGLDSFKARFGFLPHGMWLPECGYYPGLDEVLSEKGVGYIFTDTHGLRHAWPAPPNDVYAPVHTKNGVAVFARDPETSAQVWSMGSGYPGDEDYREYYRDIGFELDEDYLKHFLPYPVRVNTGFKYWRVTGGNLPKELYNPKRAYAKALTHAANFHFNRERQIEYLHQVSDAPPVVTAPYDMELFGHWWFEGPDFLGQVFRSAAANPDTYTFSTPQRYLDAHGCVGVTEMFHSSWGEGGYSRVWLNPSNDWIYPELHDAESCLIAQASSFPSANDDTRRILHQMCRELLLAQSSDWPFMLNAGTTDEYARNRITGHLANFRKLTAMLADDRVEERALAAMEKDVSGLFPGIDVSEFASQNGCAAVSEMTDPAVLMLSWEYPPLVMGGLSRHVDDLSQALAEQEGRRVSVLTSRGGNIPDYDVNHQVCVFRASPYQRAGEDIDFHDWVIQLNMAYFNLAQKIVPASPFLVLHAHDWLVGAAALGIKRYWRLPLVATIHATEIGRNNGIHTPLQRKIHDHEAELVHNADRIICCSEYMAGEVAATFAIPPEKITVIQNGVMPQKVIGQPLTGSERRRYAADDEAMIYFVGRLVREKGVDVLLKALPRVFAAHPRTKAVISGKGPMYADLKKLARAAGIADRIVFTGFVDDFERNRLLASADLAVFPSLYEPFGIVALEAMAGGVPVVVSDVGGMGEVIEHGVDGLKCPPGNTGALSEAILTLLADPLLRMRLAEKGREKALTSFSWQTLAAKTNQLYRDVWDEAQQNTRRGGER